MVKIFQSLNMARKTVPVVMLDIFRAWNNTTDEVLVGTFDYLTHSWVQETGWTGEEIPNRR